MGHPAYQITSGTIHYGQNIEDMEVFERARAGMFLSFQYPAAIPGVQVGTFLRKSVVSVRGEAFAKGVSSRTQRSHEATRYGQILPFTLRKRWI